MAAHRNTYTWDDESREQRPSEFAASSYSTTAGVFHTSWAQDRALAQRRARRAVMLWPLLITLGLALLALVGIASFLRG